MQEPDGLSDEALDGIIEHLIDVDTVSLGIKGVVLLAGLDRTLGERVDGKLGAEGLPLDGVELDDFTVNQDLLVGEGLLLGIEKFNGIFGCLLFLVLIHHSQVVTLGVEEKLERLGVVKGLNSGLAGWDLDKADSWVLGFTWKSGINEEVSVRSPHDILNTINSNRLLDSIRSLNKLHCWQLIDTDTSFNFVGAIFLGDILLEFLGKIVSIGRPNIDMAVFSLLLIKVSDLLN